MYVCMYACVYIYIYIERERERNINVMCVYITYIHIASRDTTYTHALPSMGLWW